MCKLGGCVGSSERGRVVLECLRLPCEIGRRGRGEELHDVRLVGCTTLDRLVARR